jgi:hypothetical protein
MSKHKSTDIPVENLEQEIIVFLDSMANKPGGKRTKPGCNLRHGKACALGTCVDNEPRVTPIDLYNDGLTIWLLAEPGGKIANIMRNPNVSVGVYEPVDHSLEQKSLQYFGTAEIINMKNNPDECSSRLASFGIAEALKGMIEEYALGGKLPEGQSDALYERFSKMVNLIKITPKKMILLHMAPGEFPVRKTWEPGKAVMQSLG